MSEPQLPEEPAIAGERNAEALHRSKSLQSRLSSVLAIGVMAVLGLGMLSWYYAHALSRPGRAQADAKSQAQKRAQGDMPLPRLGPISAPMPELRPVNLPEAVVSAQSSPVIESQPLPMASPTPYAPPAEKSPAELVRERQLSGSVFAMGSGLAAGATNPPSGQPPGIAPQGELGPLLQPSTTTTVRAEILPTQRLLLPKGAFLDCTLETAIDSTLPGMTTCVMATDSFGADGQVVLLERGTKLVGETRGQVAQGSSRVFVLWTEARTPSGVIVPLASPGTDELGRSGLAGEVDRHFFERFGAAMLVSVIEGAVQAGVQSSRGGNGAVIVNPSSTQDVMTEVLKNTIAIPPTVTKRQGDRVQVLVARDLDFRSVYELKSVAP
jgi:type IV secretion system protein VirB10